MKDAINTKALMISIPLSINALGVALCIALFCGGGLVFISHMLTVRSMHNEMERWSTLSHALTETAGDCVALLPPMWTGKSRNYTEDRDLIGG